MVVGDGVGQYLAYSVVATTTTSTSSSSSSSSSSNSVSSEKHQYESIPGGGGGLGGGVGLGGVENELLDYLVSPLWACDLSRLRMATSQDAQGQGLPTGATPDLYNHITYPANTNTWFILPYNHITCPVNITI